MGLVIQIVALSSFIFGLIVGWIWVDLYYRSLIERLRYKYSKPGKEALYSRQTKEWRVKKKKKHTRI